MSPCRGNNRSDQDLVWRHVEMTSVQMFTQQTPRIFEVLVARRMHVEHGLEIAAKVKEDRRRQLVDPCPIGHAFDDSREARKVAGLVPETKTQPSGDQSGVQGLPGNKSGPTQRPSTLGR
jgi:hypothetical protein